MELVWVAQPLRCVVGTVGDVWSWYDVTLAEVVRLHSLGRLLYKKSGYQRSSPVIRRVSPGEIRMELYVSRVVSHSRLGTSPVTGSRPVACVVCMGWSAPAKY